MTQLPHYAQKYRIKGNRLYETVAGKNGTFERLLCNFVSWITAEITLDDGAETTTWIRLRGIHESGRTLPEIEIPAADLAGFNWLAQRWGMDCILEVGKTVKDCVRHAIQTTAANAEKKTVFAVTGWKKIGEKWYYLMPGDEEITVALPDKMSGYCSLRKEQAHPDHRWSAWCSQILLQGSKGRLRGQAFGVRCKLCSCGCPAGVHEH